MDFVIELESFLALGDGTFAQCYQPQIKPIHIAAYYLLPESHAKGTPAYFDSQIQTFLHRYTTSETDYRTICFEFESFRAQEPPFEYEHHCWTLISHQKLFWHSTFSHTQLLSKLAYRVFCCPVNSVASERVLSAQNLIHTKTRNSLQSEQADKLVYLYINGRCITQFNNKLDLASELKSKPLRDLTVHEEVDLEKILMGEELEGEIIEDGIDSEGDENAENAEKLGGEGTDDNNERVDIDCLIIVC